MTAVPLLICVGGVLCCFFCGCCVIAKSRKRKKDQGGIEDPICSLFSIKIFKLKLVYFIHYFLLSDPVRGHPAAGAHHPRVHRQRAVAAPAPAAATGGYPVRAGGQPAAGVSGVRLQRGTEEVLN